MTWQQLLEEGIHRLEEAGVADAKLDAWYLMEEISGLDMSRFLLCRNEEVKPADAGLEEAYQAALSRRSLGEPLQYITGKASFMGYTFEVSPEVLIPRQDTETLCETALERLKQKEGPVRILDLCTGSGCILISLVLLGEAVSGVGADISEKALEVARGNALRLCPGKTRFVRSDMFADIRGRFNMIVSNPPYIRSGDIPGLMREVAGHEPLQALDGGEDGLAFYRILAGRAGSYLVPGGELIMEIGYDQAADVTGLLKEAGWSDISVIKDLPGHDRVVCAQNGKTGKQNCAAE